MLSIAATLGIITGALFLMPAVTAFVGSFFVDEIADEVERTHYPMEPPGTALPLFRALIEGINTALLAVLVYLVAVPLLFVAGLGLVIMFLANAYLLSREYFLLAAMRFRPPAEAKAMRRAYRGQIFLAGLLIAMFVSIPIVNLATPLFAHGDDGAHAQAAVAAPRDVPAEAGVASVSAPSHGLLFVRRHRSGNASTVFPGHLHKSAITHFSHSGRRARQM